MTSTRKGYLTDYGRRPDPLPPVARVVPVPTPEQKARDDEQVRLLERTSGLVGRHKQKLPLVGKKWLRVARW